MVEAVVVVALVELLVVIAAAVVVMAQQIFPQPHQQRPYKIRLQIQNYGLLIQQLPHRIHLVRNNLALTPAAPIIRPVQPMRAWSLSGIDFYQLMPNNCVAALKYFYNYRTFHLFSRERLIARVF